MTNEQINMAAQEYADQHFIERVATGAPWPEAKKAYAKAFADGDDIMVGADDVEEWCPIPD